MGNKSVVSVYSDGDATVTDDGITIEPNCTLTNLVEALRKVIP